MWGVMTLKNCCNNSIIFKCLARYWAIFKRWIALPKVKTNCLGRPTGGLSSRRVGVGLEESQPNVAQDLEKIMPSILNFLSFRMRIDLGSSVSRQCSWDAFLVLYTGKKMHVKSFVPGLQRCLFLLYTQFWAPLKASFCILQFCTDYMAKRDRIFGS